MEAVLFDMDGLLVDSEKIWFQVETEVMERLGGEWGPEHQEHLVGGSMPATVAYMLRSPAGAPRPGGGGLDAGGHGRQARRRVEMMPGAAELLEEVRAGGPATALVTSSVRPIAEPAWGASAGTTSTGWSPATTSRGPSPTRSRT